MATSLFLDKSFNWVVLFVLNIVLIIAAETLGDGSYFADSGLIHAVAVVFVALIIVRIFSEYAFSDHILRGFLRIQLGFFLFLGLIHVYEYLGLHVLFLNEVVVEATATLCYLLWLIGNMIAVEFVLRIYRQSSAWMIGMYGVLALSVAVIIVSLHVWSDFVLEAPEWTHGVVLSLVVGLGVLSMWRLIQIKSIMPVFKYYVLYALPAVVLIIFATFSEYSESEGFFEKIGLPVVQNLYLSHFLIYAALSLLLIGFGKLKRPTGIYADM